MDRDKAKKALEKELDRKLGNILLEFEEGMCKIWETENWCKNQKLTLICEYAIRDKNRIQISTEIGI
jgi:hypothetical protein